MEIGDQVMAWRRFKGLTQDALARRAGLTRAYISRLEGGRVDPGLSSLRSVASAMEMTLSLLLEEAPEAKVLTRHELDRLARATLRPGTQEARGLSAGRLLARVIQERRRALGLYKPRVKRSNRPRVDGGRHAARWLRAWLGEAQWKALLRRIDKLASAQAGAS